jgi:outer membrane protein OmpA-like peptidoglycan-associated protein
MTTQSTTKTLSMGWILGLAIPAALLVGCAAALPPKELVDARAAYQRAQTSKGAELQPVPLHEAKLALDAAEASFVEEPEATRTVSLAYVASRKAELAESQGNIAGAVAMKGQAEKDLVALQGQALANTKQGLASAQDELARTKGQLNQTQGQLNMTAEQLAAEKKAREAAEKRARDAMDKLAVAAALSIKEETRGTVIVLPGSVLFASNKWDLLPGAQEKLNAVAEALKNQEDHKMVVEGHTDSQGTEASNLELGQKRAQAVRDYLVSRGVKAATISATGIGQGRPIADNKSPEGRANNRRVEVIVQPIEKR